MEAVDLFSGAGGLSLGLRRAGFEVVLSNEYSVDPEWTYRANLLREPELLEVEQAAWSKYGRYSREGRALVRNYLVEQRTQQAKTLRTRFWGGGVATLFESGWLSRWRQARGYSPDLLVGGPPCQGFSAARHSSGKDARNDLVFQMLRAVDVLRPKVVVIENVPGMLERHTPVVGKVGCALVQKGYRVVAELLATAQYGVPQSRERLIIVGVRGDLVEPGPYLLEKLRGLVYPVACPVESPVAMHGSAWLREALGGGSVSGGRRLTASAILGDLSLKPPPQGKGTCEGESYRTAAAISAVTRELRTEREYYMKGLVGSLEKAGTMNERYHNHERTMHRARVAERLEELRLRAQQDPDLRCGRELHARLYEVRPDLRTKKAAQRVLVSSEWPGLTVTSLPDDIVHYESGRIPTVREVARLQSFPDWFEFKGVRTTGAERRKAGIYVPQYTQVANAVPPRLSFALGLRLRHFIQRLKSDPTCSFNLPGGTFRRHTTGSDAKKIEDLARLFASVDDYRFPRPTISAVARSYLRVA